MPYFLACIYKQNYAAFSQNFSILGIVNFLLNLSAINILTVKEGLLVDGPIVAAVFKIKITFFSKKKDQTTADI